MKTNNLYAKIFKWQIGKYPHQLDERQMSLVNEYYAKIGLVGVFLLFSLVMIQGIVSILSYLLNQDWYFNVSIVYLFVLYAVYSSKNPFKIGIELLNPDEFTEIKINKKFKKIKTSSWMTFIILTICLVVMVKVSHPNVPAWLVLPLILIGTAAIARFEYTESKKFMQQVQDNIEQQQDYLD